MTEERCPTCGRLLDKHQRHLRFRLPQPVLEVPASEHADRTWGNDVLMQVRDVGAFVRVLVPVRLTGGYTITYAVWLAVHPDDLRRAGCSGGPPRAPTFGWPAFSRTSCPRGKRRPTEALVAAVRDPDAAPYAADSDDAFREEWPHEVILDATARGGMTWSSAGAGLDETRPPPRCQWTKHSTACIVMPAGG